MTCQVMAGGCCVAHFGRAKKKAAPEGGLSLNDAAMDQNVVRRPRLMLLRSWLSSLKRPV
jgi:hypothetical protein